MVSKITATLTILLIIGFINKSLADNDRNARMEKLMKETKLQCYQGVEVNPKDVSEFSSKTTLKSCSQIRDTNFIDNTYYPSVNTISCGRATYINYNGDIIVTRTCTFMEGEKCTQVKWVDTGIVGEICVCSDKDGCNSSSSIHFNIVFLIMSFAIVYFFAYN